MSRVALQSSRRISGSLRPDTSNLIRVDRLRRDKFLPRVQRLDCPTRMDDVNDPQTFDSHTEYSVGTCL